MLTRKHLQFVSVALVLATATACFHAAPLTQPLPRETTRAQTFLYSAQASTIFVLSSSQYRNPQGLFFHALNAFFGKKPVLSDAQARSFYAGSISEGHSDLSDHCTLLALNCMLTL